MKKLIFLVLVVSLVTLGVVYFQDTEVEVQLPVQDPVLSGVFSLAETSASSIAPATSTINTTSTQVFSSITKIGQIINDTTGKITCSMDATGTTAASSTVFAGRGIIIYPSASTTMYNSAMFGECYPGATNCYTHKGAVNCLATGAVTVTKWSK